MSKEIYVAIGKTDSTDLPCYCGDSIGNMMKAAEKAGHRNYVFQTWVNEKVVDIQYYSLKDVKNFPNKIREIAKRIALNHENKSN